MSELAKGCAKACLDKKDCIENWIRIGYTDTHH